MSLSLSTLADEIEIALSAETGANAIAEAFGEYFKGATLGPVPVSGAIVDSSGKAAIESGMSLSDDATPAEGATELSNGMLAFWLDMVAKLPTYFTNGLPPLIQAGVVGSPSLLATALLSAFSLNNLPGVTTAQAAANLAAAIHPLAGLGGTATVVATTTPIL